MEHATDNPIRFQATLDILSERARQERIGWSQAHDDDQENEKSFAAYITVYLGQAVRGTDWKFNPEGFRLAMVKVAALALAAIEWVDRRRG